MSSTTSTTSSTPSLSFRLVTWNIHKGIGGIDRLYRPQRITQVLRKCRADLVFLQEVDEGVPRSRLDRQVDLLGDDLDYPHRAYFPNVRLRVGHYGNAILSRFPLEHQENLDLTRPFKKRRSALHVRIAWHAHPARRLWLFNVHLGLAEYERRQQLRLILDYLAHHHPAHETPVVVGGDFNDVWGSLGPRVLVPAGFVHASRSRATFPAVQPMRALDRVFVRGPVALRRSRVIRAALAREASDHLPVVTTLDGRW